MRKKVTCACPKTIKINQGPTYCLHVIYAALSSSRSGARRAMGSK